MHPRHDKNQIRFLEQHIGNGPCLMLGGINAEQRIYLLKEFTNIPKGFESDLDIADPIGRSHEAYEECMLTIKEGIAKIVKLI